MPKFIIHVAETEHYEIEVEADSAQAALEEGQRIWREAPEIGGYQIPDTETEYNCRQQP